MLATRTSITDYIPQRAPFVMVHDLLEVDEVHAVTQFDILPDNVLAEDGHFKEPGLVENIAQTAAVQLGYIFRKKGMDIPIGYIAAIKDLVVHELPRIGSTIVTEVKITNKVLEVTVAKGQVVQNNKVLCSCEMRIFSRK